MTDSAQTPPDPWKSFRGVMAGTLILEAIVVLLALPVVGLVGRGWSTWSVGCLVGFAVLLVLLAGVQGRPAAIWINLAAQLILIARAGLQEIQVAHRFVFDAVPDRELHPCGHHTRGDLEVDVVIGDGGDGALQAGGGVHPVAHPQRLVQVDRGLHGLPLASRGEEHEGAHDDDQGQEAHEFHGSAHLFRVCEWFPRRARAGSGV